MTGRQQLYILVSHLAIGFLIVISASVLCALHDVDPQAVVAIFGTAVGLVGGSAGSMAMLAGVVNGKSVVTQQHLADLTAAQPRPEGVLPSLT